MNPLATHDAFVREQWPILWLAKHVHRTNRGLPITFREKPYLVELYQDFDKIDGADFRKCVQVGITELFIQMVLERAGWAGRICTMVYPTAQIRNKVVNARINPIIQLCPGYAERLPRRSFGSKDGPENIALKKFGKGLLYLLGSNAHGEFTEFSTDLAIVDEYDECDRQNVELLRDRLAESKHPQLFRVGNPTSGGVGISLLYDESDGRRWHHQCTRCGERQPMDWETSIVEQTDGGIWVPRDKARIDDVLDIRPVCRRCRRPFERQAEGGGWVAERPSVKRRGYTLSRMDALNVSLRELFEEWTRAQGHGLRLERFERSILGRPTEGAGNKLTPAILQKAALGLPLDPIGGEHYKPLRTTAGIDVGNDINVVVSSLCPNGSEGLIGSRSARMTRWMGTVKTFEELVRVCRRYRVSCAVIDSRPEGRKAQEFRDALRRHGITVWLAQFHPQPTVGSEEFALKLNAPSSVVTVDRTQLLDATFDDLLHGRSILPRDYSTVLGFETQMCTPVRKLNDAGDRYIWTKTEAPDHYRLAHAYDRVAQELLARGASFFVVDTEHVEEEPKEAAPKPAPVVQGGGYFSDD